MHLERIYQEYHGRGVEVTFIVPEASDYTRENGLPHFSERFGVSYTALDDRDGEVAHLLGAEPGVPRNLLIDREGMLRFAGESSPWTAMATEIESLLGELDEPDLSDLDKAMAALGSPRSYVRWQAAQALGKMRDKAAVQPLLNALSDESTVVRESAAEALGEIGGKRALEPLIAALDDEVPYVRLQIVGSLGKMRDTLASSSLVKSLTDSVLREAAAGALAEMEEPELVFAELEKIGDNLDQEEMSEISYAYSSLASAYQQRGMYKTAIQALLKAIDLRPDYLYLRESLIYCYFQTGKNEQAIDELLDIMESVPSSAVGGRMFHTDGTVEVMTRRERYLSRFRWEITRSFDYLEEKLAEPPQNSALYEVLGSIYLVSRGMYHDAISMYEKAIELSPDGSKNYYHLALAYSKAGMTDEAIAAVGKLVDSAIDDEYSAVIQSMLARVYLNCEMYDDAINAYRSAISIAQDDKERWQHKFGLANSYELAGKHSEAVARYEDVINNSQDSYVRDNACSKLAEVYESKGQDESAIAVYLILIGNASDEVGSWLNQDDGVIVPYSGREGRIKRLIDLFQKSDKLKELADILGAKLAESPHDSILHQVLGQIYENQELSEKSINVYEKLLEVEPDSIKFLFRLASACNRAGNTDRAITIARRMSEIEFEDPAYQSLIARVYLDCERYDDAAEAFRKALEMPAPRYAWQKAGFQYGLANCHAKAGRYAEAIREYESVIQNESNQRWRDRAAARLEDIRSKIESS